MKPTNKSTAAGLRRVFALSGSKRGPLTLAALAFFLAGCADVPDAANPIEWYKSAKNALTGESPDKAGDPGDPSNRLVADRDKPATAPVEMALAGSGIECGAEVWFAGDTKIDLECAHNTGCVPVLVRADAPKPREFGPFAPVWHVTDCLALCKLIGRL